MGMGIVLRVLVAAGLAVDAVVHWRLAPDFSPGAHSPSGVIPADDLFRAEAAAAVVAGLLVLFWARRWTYAIAFIVAASAAGAVLLYYSVDVGQLGPLPKMYDPNWTSDKSISLAGEAVAAIAALVGFFTAGRAKRSESHAAPASVG